jgi:hypothetical protein
VTERARTTSKKPAEPPYGRYAFLNPYNLSLLAGAGVAAAATGQWWLGIGAAAVEGLWMLFAPDSKVLRRAWFDRVWEESKRADEEKRLNAKFRELPPPDRQRAFQLHEQKMRLQQLAAENPSLTVELMKEELAKIDGLIDDFLSLALVCGRFERHLATFDFDALNRQWKAYTRDAGAYPPGDMRRDVAEKNISVLQQRRARYDDLRRGLETARGQMDLMENTLRLLSDEIVSMADASQLGARLDDLRIGVEAIRETSRTAEEAYERELEEQLARAPQARR